jgi:hypothetical protein
MSLLTRYEANLRARLPHSSTRSTKSAPVHAAPGNDGGEGAARPWKLRDRLDARYWVA